MADKFSFHRLRLGSPAFADPRCQREACTAVTERAAEYFNHNGGLVEGGVLLDADGGVTILLRAKDPRDCENAAVGMVSGLYAANLWARAAGPGDFTNELHEEILRYGFDVRHERGVAVSDVEWSALQGAGRKPAN